tara:strand:- start:214 stop:453 length:240 start_codon:yes stop_codon:yes gene_type:complete
VHDLIDYEARGIPTVMVASAAFVQPAEHQAAALGMPEIAQKAVYVPHPIQDATDDEMRQKARDSVDKIIAALRNNPSPN